MGVQVSPNYDNWIARYPEFAATVSDALYLEYFAEAEIHHRNDGSGPVEKESVQIVLLNMMTAHIAWLNRLDPVTQQPVNPLAGRINNATEGSVSVGIDVIQTEGAYQWLVQSTYGSAYWYATMPYRQMRYLRGPRRYFGPIFPGFPTFR